MRKINLFLGLGCFLVLAFSWPLRSQVLYGTLVGTVEDESGAVIVGARITASNSQTGMIREVVASGLGNFSFPDLTPGLYDIRVTAPGFQVLSLSGVTVTINTVARVDPRLRIGLTTETVTVAAAAVALQTDQADVHVELRGKEIVDLPIPIYRNYQALLNLVPGSSPAMTQNSPLGSPGRALATNINGATRNTNNTRLDGANNVRPQIPSQTYYVPPAESIETVNVSTNSFDAEQGFAGGAAINVVTKSGTNEFRGVLFNYHDNHVFQAKDFFYKDEKKAKYIVNQYGGTLGGPIRRDKLFFFGSFDGIRERQNQSTILTVAAEDQRRGDFSRYNVRLFDPLTGNPNGSGRTEFPNGQIPLSRQSASIRKLQDLVPAANQPGITNNYFASTPVVFDRDQYDVKINWVTSPNTMIWAKYSAMEADATGQFTLGRAGGPGLPWGAGLGDVLTQLATLAGNHVFTPNFIVDSNFGWSRMANANIGNDAGENLGLNFLGIPGTNGPDPRQSGLPLFLITGYTSLGQTDTWFPKIAYEQSWTYAANFGWTKGTHNIRFGVDIAREQRSHVEPGGTYGPRGGFRFDGGVTALQGGTAPNQYNTYAAFLMGLPSGSGKSLQFFDPATSRDWRHGYYFRDRWQATRNLTLSLGLRWEYYPITTRAHSGIERFDPITNQVLLGRLGGNPDTVGITASKADFAPRVGIAYRLGQSTVVRTGYGISVDPDLISRAIINNYPAVVRADFLPANSFQPVNAIEQGIPSFSVPDISSGVISMPLDITTNFIYPGIFNRGYIQSFNFIVERQLPWNLVGSMGYVGTRTIGQQGNLDINTAPVGGGAAGRPLARLYGRRVSTGARMPFLNSTYDSLQAKLDRRFSGGIMMKVAYTWGKAIGYTDESGGGLLWNDLSQFRRNRAVAGFDRTHTFRMAWVWELPFGNGKRWRTDRFSSAVLGGWQLNGIFSSYTGTPFTVTAPGTSLNAPGDTQTADQVNSTVKKLGGVGSSPFYDRSAFAPVRDVRYGSTGRNILRGPGLVNVDLSMFRTFAITERFQLQFRAESFNFTNTPHFANPSSDASAASFMLINSTVGSGSTFNAEGRARAYRFGLRLSF